MYLKYCIVYINCYTISNKRIPNGFFFHCNNKKQNYIFAKISFFSIDRTISC